MNFLNPLLLFGALAFAIPLVIHLLNRRRLQEVHWGAVHLLHNVVKKNHRRLRIEQLLLLMIRIGIPILLALLMAKPVLTRSIKWLKDQRISTLFLIDNSYSMRASGMGDASHFSHAKESITKITENLTAGSDTAGLLIAGDQPRNLTDDPMTGRKEFVERLQQVSANGNPAGVAQALQASLAELNEMDNVAREVIVVSDFQSKDWLSPAAAMHRRSAVESLGEGKTPVNITLLRVGENTEGGSAAKRENLAVLSVVPSQAVVGVNQKVVLRATIANFGRQSYPDLEVRCIIDGQPHRASRITVGPEQQMQALFTHTFDSPGTHVVEVQLEPDGLPIDDHFVTVVPVLDNLPTLLLVNRENLAASPLQGDADFVELALQPHGSSALNPRELKDLIVTNKMSEDRAHDQIYAESRVAIMTNVNQMRGGLGRLREFVKRGGGLLIFLGGDADVDWYNREMFQSGDGLLPMPILRVDGKGMPAATAARASVRSQVFEHPALSFFNDPRNGQLGRASWTRWFRLGMSDDIPTDVKEKVAKNAIVLARLSQGDPLFVEKKYGEGRVIMAAVPADASWGNLPTHPFFVPLMQRLVTNLAASVAPPRNLSPGNKIVSFVPHNHPGRTVQIVDPSGEVHECNVKRERRRGIVEFSETWKPGTYRLTDATGKVEHYVVNLTRSESDLTLLSGDEIRTLSKEMDAPVANGWQEYLALDRERRMGTGIWRPLIWVLLALLFIEVLFQQWMTRRKLLS